MTTETDVLVIELPDTMDEPEKSALAEDLETVENVKGVGSLDSRSVDPGMIGEWVQVASGVLTIASTAVPFLTGLIGRLRSRQIRGARIRLSNGAVIEADSATPEELERLVRAASTPNG